MQLDLTTTRVVVVLVVAGLLASCSPDDSVSRPRAEQLVEATQQAGVASGLTVEVAEALYRDDAATVCEPFRGGLNSAERLLLLGNPSNRRHKTITDHSIEYARIVVDIYCPERGDDFRDEVDDLDPYASDKLQRGQP